MGRLKHQEKDEIITIIEDNRGGLAFDDDVTEVLRKLTCVDLFTLLKAFNETFEEGRRLEKQNAED